MLAYFQQGELRSEYRSYNEAKHIVTWHNGSTRRFAYHRNGRRRLQYQGAEYLSMATGSETARGVGMIRSKLMTGIFALVMVVALDVWPGMVKSAHGQGTRNDDIVFNSRGVLRAGAQLPDVILHSDPTSPTFSSINSTGAINAFSLNLTGNLTVNGSTTVVGKLASGTLNLSKQGIAPGAPTAGTANLYIKSADKRLYYKVETGTEIGPIASPSGAQTSVVNTFTVPQTVDANFYTKGPNPSYDVTRYGGYIGDNYNTSVNGTISASSAILTVSGALDFANGQGILVLGAGPAPSIATPTGVTAAPLGVTGSTSYSYCVVDEDYANGRTPCSASGTVANGNATLGIQSATITKRQRSGGVVTITTSATHNFINGSQVNITGTGDASFEGAFTLTSASGTTLTYNQYGVGDVASRTSTGSAQVGARNRVVWNAPVGYTTLKHLIYRCRSGCRTIGANYALAGVSVGMDSSFDDYGYAFNTSTLDNGDAPSTAPTSASNRWLSTTISSGGGTTTLRLKASSTNAVAGAKVLHDNAPILLSLCQNFAASAGGMVYVPAPANGTSPRFPINSTMNLGQTCSKPLEIDFAAQVWVNGAIMVAGEIKGVVSGNSGQAAAGYINEPTAWLSGFAYPMMYMMPNHSGNNSLENLLLTCNQVYQPCLYLDNDTIGQGVTVVRHKAVSLAGATANTPYVLKGGFGYFWEGGSISVTATSFNSPPAVLFGCNCGIGQTGQELPAIVYTDKTSIFGGIVADSCGKVLHGPGGMNHMEFKELLAENQYIPVLRVNIAGGAIVYGVDFIDTTYADLLGGFSTPMFDLTNAKSGVAGFRAINPFAATGFQPVFEVSSSTSAYPGLEIEGAGGIMGTQNFKQHNKSLSIDLYQNWEAGFQGANGRVYYQMAQPAPLQSAAVKAGGSVGVGSHTYTVAAIDFDGHATVASTGITVTTTPGNQTVALTGPAVLPAGAAGWNVYRDNSSINASGCATPQFTRPGFVFNDTSSSACASGPPLTGDAGTSALSANGVSTSKLRIAGEAINASPRSEQNIFLPGALTSTWTGSTWTLDKSITVTRVQVQAKAAPSGCTTNAVVRLTDGTTPVNVTVAANANDSGAIAQNYAAATSITVSVQTAATGCTTSPADANITIQYRMQ